jgi:hypothetical protein
MALRGVQPEAMRKRLKCLVFGPAGVGKTTACLQFPKSYVIDCEKGVENYPNLVRKAGSVVYTSCDIDDVHAEIKALLTEAHDYRTLVIDPITGIWNDLLDKSERKVGNEFGRHYGEAQKTIRKINNLILRLDMNVLMTSHQKVEYGPGLVKLGDTFDAWKKYDYLFDIVLHLTKTDDGKRMATVIKQRIEPGAKGLPETFEWQYQNFVSFLGADSLEAKAKVEVLAPAEKVMRAQVMIDTLKIDAEDVDRWLQKANAASLTEMTEPQIDAVLVHLDKKMQPLNPAPVKKGAK